MNDDQARALGAELKALAEKATAEPWYVGVQNDITYIVVGAKPAPDNDYPNHGADRSALAKVYDRADGVPEGDANATLISKVHSAIALAEYWEARATELQARLGALHEVVKDADAGKLDADVITIPEFLR